MAEKREKDAHVWARDPNDWYCEDRASVDFLLDREQIDGCVYDPACGGGNIVMACEDRGIHAFGTDLIRRTYHTPAWFFGIHDFIAGPVLDLEGVGAIISNPPYYRAKGTEAFIRNALAHDAEKVIMVVNAKFLFGGARAAGLFTRHPPSRVWPISPRPSMPPGEWIRDGGKIGGGTEDFCWLVWERRLIRAGSRGCSIAWGAPDPGDVI